MTVSRLALTSESFIETFRLRLVDRLLDRDERDLCVGAVCVDTFTVGGRDVCVSRGHRDIMRKRSI